MLYDMSRVVSRSCRVDDVKRDRPKRQSKRHKVGPTSTKSLL